ncbi:MAG: glycosyltransferase [Bacteroidota bacterium]
MLFKKDQDYNFSSISVVICSRNGAVSKALIANIKNTIGLENEIIIIDNTANKYSIFQAYNLGLDRSQKDIVCFLHEDILFHTQNWGKILRDIFLSDPLAGLIGIAGGKIKCSMPSAWWDSGKNAVHIIQHFNHKPEELRKNGFEDLVTLEVAAIDGVFMVMRRNKSIRFDERLKGFHNYDLHLSMLHHMLKKKVLVTDKILIEHFSHGNLNRAWYESTSFFHKLYKKNLPVVRGNFSKSTLKKKEITVGFRFINGLVQNKLYKDAFYWWYQIFKLAPFSRYHLKFLIKLVS